MTGISYREKIIAYAKQKGPLLPNDVARLLKTDTMRAGAMLSEMSENKLLRISTLKVGGSPLYYLPDQPEKLEMFVGKLNEKDRKVFGLLKERKVLRDAELDTLTRFSLRTLKDFAHPFHVSTGHDAELYWRIYSLTPEEALEVLHPKKPEPPKPPIPEQPAAPEPAAVQQPKKVARRKASPLEDPLVIKVVAHLAGKGMTATDPLVVTKKKEMECIAVRDGAQLFCKAKDKKSVTDVDIAAVFGQAAARKMPALFLITGSLTKKAQAALVNFPGLAVERF